MFLVDDIDERVSIIKINTPFDDELDDYTQMFTCILEVKGFISDTKYCTLTEKGRMLL